MAILVKRKPRPLAAFNCFLMAARHLNLPTRINAPNNWTDGQSVAAILSPGQASSAPIDSTARFDRFTVL
jgi:hypothetical protein